MESTRRIFLKDIKIRCHLAFGCITLHKETLGILFASCLKFIKMHLFLQMLEHDIQESLGTGDAAAQCRLNLSRSVIFPQLKNVCRIQECIILYYRIYFSNLPYHNVLHH